jgi:hypothetical protein
LSQDNEVTAQLRQNDKHPALRARPPVRPMLMWLSSGKREEGDGHGRLEIRVCPPGRAHDGSFHDKLTGWPYAAACLYREKDEAQEFLGYMTSFEAKWLAQVLLDLDEHHPPSDSIGPSVMEVTGE